jgi:hypothetical protein
MAIPRKVQSLNRIGSHGSARFAYAKIKSDWLRDVRTAMVISRIPAAERFRRVVIERRYSGRERRMDFGNFAGGGCKPILDAMVKVGLLRDDSERWSAQFYRQAHDCRWSGVRITIEEIEPKADEAMVMP